MKIAVLSGKGGAGKTFVSVNLAVAASHNNSTQIVRYLDCDVEEPNGHLFLKPENVEKTEVLRTLPVFDSEKCNGCRECVDFCKFNALAMIGGKPKVFKEICHSCGAGVLICKQDAIEEVPVPIGMVETGKHENVEVVTGILNLGEASGVGVISTALSHARADDFNVIDAPPGSACTVMESVQDSDYTILVVEPTSFGIHNFKMVHELVKVLDKPCGIIINKSSGDVPELIDYCHKHNLKILADFPFSKEIAKINSESDIAYDLSEEAKKKFDELYFKVIKEV